MIAIQRIKLLRCRASSSIPDQNIKVARFFYGGVYRCPGRARVELCGAAVARGQAAALTSLALL